MHMHTIILIAIFSSVYMKRITVVRALIGFIVAF